jgi:cellulose biosynthesis protein BcsQ
MAKHISFFSSKGGQGKTTLAVNFALYTNAFFYTNDFRNGTETIYNKFFTENRFKIIEENSENIELNYKDNVVFDFGGYIDKKIPFILKESDLCIIPLMYQSNIDLKSFSIVINSISEINRNIFVVINNTESKYLDQLYKAISINFGYPTYIIKRSLYMSYLANQGLNPFLINAPGITKNSLIELQNQLKLFFEARRSY